jgi:hypothetical protein
MPKTPKKILLYLDTSRTADRRFFNGIARYYRFRGPCMLYRKPPFYVDPHRRPIKAADAGKMGITAVMGRFASARQAASAWAGRSSMRSGG